MLHRFFSISVLTTGAATNYEIYRYVLEIYGIFMATRSMIIVNFANKFNLNVQRGDG